MNEKRKVFRSRVSVLLMIILLLIFLPEFILIFRSGNIFANPGFYIMAGVILLMAFIFSGIRYEIADEQLQISTWGTCKWNCPLSQIVSVERSYNPLASGAASLKRLCIRFKKSFDDFPYCLISPVREQEFLEILKQQNPDIYIRVEDKKGWWRFWNWDF